MPGKAQPHGAPVRQYLNGKVTGPLLEGMKLLAKEQYVYGAPRKQTGKLITWCSGRKIHYGCWGSIYFKGRRRWRGHEQWDGMEVLSWEFIYGI